MTYTEPNALPLIYSSWQEWRTTYEQHVAEFKTGNKGTSDVLQLKLRLQRLGYFGVRLEDEIRFVKG